MLNVVFQRYSLTLLGKVDQITTLTGLGAFGRYVQGGEYQRERDPGHGGLALAAQTPGEAVHQGQALEYYHGDRATAARIL